MSNQELLHYIEVIRCTLMGRYRVSEETANEAVYRAFAKVWDKDYDPQAFQQYFTVAAKNELIHMFRRQKKWKFEAGIPEDIEAYEPTDYEQTSKTLDEIADHLPDVYVELFRLLRKGIDHREIANRLNKSHGAVRVMKTRMIQYCQAVLVALLLCFTLPFMAAGQDTLTVHDAQIIAPGLYQTLYDTVTHHDSTTTVIKNDLSVLKDVSWQHEKSVGGDYNLIHVSGISYSDSLEFEWQGDSLKKKTIRPVGNFSFTVKTKYLGKANITLRGHDSLWTVERRLTLNTAYLDTLGGQTSITDIEVMALADTPYERFPWDGITVISNDQTDYVGYMPLSLLSQQWWDELENADAGKFRIAKDDAPDNDTSATELAFEIVDLDTVNQTGQLWFRWSGTLPATSPDEVRIYASQDSYTSYGPTDTFGRNAVWVNDDGVYQMNDDPSGTAPQLTDATGNGNDGTANGSMTSGDLISGKLGQAISFDGVDDAFTFDGSLGFMASPDFGLSIWFRTTNTTDVQCITGTIDDGSSKGFQMHINTDLNEAYDAESVLFFDRDTGSLTNRGDVETGVNMSDGNWHHLVIHFDGSTPSNNEGYLDGSAMGYSNSSNNTLTDATDWGYPVALGARNLRATLDRFIDSDISFARYFTTLKTADYYSLEYANQNDPAGFWGTPTFVAAGGGGTSISGTAALTDNPESAALSGSLTLAGQAAAVDNPEALAGLGSVSISASVTIVDNPEAISSDLALMLAGSSSMTGRPELASLAGTLSLAASGALTGNAESTQLQAVLLLTGSGALSDNPEELSITGSFGDIIRGSAGLVDNAESAGATGRLIIGGAAALGDAPANMSIDGNLLLAAQAALEDSEQSFQALCDVILSMSIALTDNPEQLLARQLVISDKVKIQVTGQRVGNTITISGERVDGEALVSGPKVSPKTTVN